MYSPLYFGRGNYTKIDRPMKAVYHDYHTRLEKDVMDLLDFGPNLGTFLVSLSALAAGIAYNAVINQLKDDGKLEGYSAIAVVVGVLITAVFASLFVGLWSILIVGWFFVCTGTPMIVGDVTRAWAEKQATDEQIREILRAVNRKEEKNADTTRIPAHAGHGEGNGPLFFCLGCSSL
jgi:hypothetical protein